MLERVEESPKEHALLDERDCSETFRTDISGCHGGCRLYSDRSQSVANVGFAAMSCVMLYLLFFTLRDGGEPLGQASGPSAG